MFVESEGPKPQKLCVPQRGTHVDWSSFQLAIIRHRMDLTCTDIAPSAKISLTDRDPTLLGRRSALSFAAKRERERSNNCKSPRGLWAWLEENEENEENPCMTGAW